MALPSVLKLLSGQAVQLAATLPLNVLAPHAERRGAQSASYAATRRDASAARLAAMAWGVHALRLRMQGAPAGL